MEFPLTITEHCFAKAILEAEIMVKGKKKGKRIAKKPR